MYFGEGKSWENSKHDEYLFCFLILYSQLEHGQAPVRQSVAVKDELVFQHTSLEDSSPRHDNNLEVIDLETRNGAKVESEENSRRNLKDVSDDEKRRRRSSFHSRGTDEERTSYGIDPEFRGDLDGQRRRSRTLMKADNQGHEVNATNIKDEEKRQLGGSSEGKSRSSKTEKWFQVKVSRHRWWSR